MAFLERLAGLIKYAVSKRGGEAGLEEMAAALGEREGAAKLDCKCWARWVNSTIRRRQAGSIT